MADDAKIPAVQILDQLFCRERRALARVRLQSFERPTRMLRVVPIVVAAVLTLAMPATAQIEPTQAPASSEVDQTLTGLPVVTANGETIGYITEVGIDDGQAVAIAYVVRSSGIGGVPVTIPSKMLMNKGDHVALALTAEQLTVLDYEISDESGKIDSETAELAAGLIDGPGIHPDGTQIGEVAVEAVRSLSAVVESSDEK